MEGIHFQDLLNRSNITAAFVPSDPVGHIVRNHHIFVFNLTSNKMYSLESTMTLTIGRNSTFISNAVVTCQDRNSEVNEQAVLHLQINGKHFENKKKYLIILHHRFPRLSFFIYQFQLPEPKFIC